MFVFIYLLIFYVLLCFSLSKVFQKVGIEAKKAWLPGINFAEWCTLIGQKQSHALWLLFPIVNIFTFAGMAVDLVRSFGKLEFKHSAAAVIFAPAIFYKIAISPKDQYLGPTVPKELEYARQIEEARKSKDSYKLAQLEQKNPYKKSAAREWVESIFFAVFAAAFIRMFLIEAYVIPTPSMEGSLNVGDFLFVSKAHYGIRMPMTIAQIPLLHNQIPILGGESYLKKPSLDYYRLPAIEKVEAGKPFVFNWPVGDSVYITQSRSYTVSQVERQPEYVQNDRELVNKIKNKDFVVRPLDKKDHYIKRCVAGPGDSLRVINRQLYRNGQPTINPKHLQFLYTVTLPSSVNVNNKKLDEWGIDYGDNAYGNNNLFNNGIGQLFLDNKQVEKLQGLSPEVKIDVYEPPIEPTKLFPFDPKITEGWSLDNYGPIWVPKSGASVELTVETLPYYRRIIEVYEHNKLEVRGSNILINGVQVDKYTFKQDYYWAMGDNRHNSEDSRAWGFVPFDHIVGKPLFIFFSTKEGSIGNGINWDRLFMSASKTD